MMTSQQKAAALYVAVYNRAPDLAGLNYWAGALEAGVPYVEMAKGFLQHPVFTYNYEGLSTKGFVENVYENMLGGSGDSAGIKFWTDALNSGTTVEQFLTSFIEAVFSYTGNDYSAQKRQTELMNRVKVALDFTERMGEKSNFSADTDVGALNVLKNPVAAMSYDALVGVDRYESSVLAAINKNKQMAGQLAWVEPTVRYSTNDLTHKTDHKWGTAYGDSFYASLANGMQTLNDQDVLDGGNGTDWLYVSLNGRHWNATTQTVEYNNVTKPTLTGVERITVKAYAPGQTLDLTDSTGVERIFLNADSWGGAPYSMDIKGIKNASVEISSLKDNMPVSLYDISGQQFKLEVFSSGQSHRYVNTELNLSDNANDIKPESFAFDGGYSYVRLWGDLSSVKKATINRGYEVELESVQLDQLVGLNLINTSTTLNNISATNWQNVTLSSGATLSLDNATTNIKSIAVEDSRYSSRDYKVDLTDSSTSSAIRIDLGTSHNFNFVADKQKSAETFVLAHKGFNLLQVENFDLSGPVKDKIDLSAFAITSMRDLTISKYAGSDNDVLISAKNGEFDGRISLVGVLADGADPVSAVSGSFIFA